MTSVLRPILKIVKLGGMLLGRLGGTLLSLLRWSSPKLSLGYELRLGYVLTAKFLAEMAQQALAYGAIVAIMRDGGSALDAAIIGLSALVPPATMGVYLGGLSDALPKRLALGGGYAGQALVCIALPQLLGTDLAALALLIFLVHAFGQISGPAESSILPNVVGPEQLSSAASKLSLASSAGAAAGTALVAPVLVRLFGVVPVIYAAGAILLFAATRALSLQSEDAPETPRLARANAGWKASFALVAQTPGLPTVLGVGILVSIFSLIFQTLAPRYVAEVLNVDPADAVYVFAPTALGTLLALAASPLLHRFPGRRESAFIGLLLVGLGVSLMALTSELSLYLDFLNPLTLGTKFGLDLSASLRTAGFLAIPIGFGTTLTATSVQTFVNSQVTREAQGRVFALQTALKNSIAIVPLLAVGAIATRTGIEPMLIAMPICMLLIALALRRLMSARPARLRSRP